MQQSDAVNARTGNLAASPLLHEGVEGENVVFERRYAENRLERMPEMAADLVRLKVGVICDSWNSRATPAKHATSTIPIVMASAGDPLGSGLVASLARPAATPPA